MQVRNEIHAYVALVRHLDTDSCILFGCTDRRQATELAFDCPVDAGAGWLLFPGIAGSCSTREHSVVVVINFAWPEAIAQNYLMQCARWRRTYAAHATSQGMCSDAVLFDVLISLRDREFMIYRFHYISPETIFRMKKPTRRNQEQPNGIRVSQEFWRTSKLLLEVKLPPF